MTLVVVSVSVLGILAVIVAGLRAGRRIDLRRTVTLHAPAETAWEGIRCLPSLYARHGRHLDLGTIDSCLPQGGGAEAPGAIWHMQGRWGSRDYWADLEVVRVAPGREVGIRLVRDSLGTHRGLRTHLATLTLEPTGPSTSKLTWRLRADLRSLRLRLAHLFVPRRLAVRLFDLGLRSVKGAIEQMARRTAVLAEADSPAADDSPDPSQPARRPDPAGLSRPPTDPTGGRSDLNG